MWGNFHVMSVVSIVKYVSPDGFYNIQILPNSITAGELTTPVEQNSVGISAVMLVVFYRCLGIHIIRHRTVT